MMLYLYVQQNQWIVVALLSGVALMLFFCLVYRAMWRPRHEEQVAEQVRITGPVSFMRWVLGFVPWAVILLAIISVVYSITHIAAASRSVPNW